MGPMLLDVLSVASAETWTRAKPKSWRRFSLQQILEWKKKRLPATTAAQLESN